MNVRRGVGTVIDLYGSWQVLGGIWYVLGGFFSIPTDFCQKIKILGMGFCGGSCRRLASIQPTPRPLFFKKG